MTRSLTNFSDDTFEWTILSEWLLPSETVRVYAGPLGATQTYSGETYYGTGDFLGFDKITETSDGRDARAIVSIPLRSGYTLSDDVTGDDTGSQVNLILARLDSNSNITEWLEMATFIGSVKYAVKTGIDESGARVQTPIIEVELQGPQSIFDRSYSVGMTNTEQLSIDSADNCLEFIGDPDLEKLSVGGVSSNIYQGVGDALLKNSPLFQ